MVQKLLLGRQAMAAVRNADPVVEFQVYSIPGESVQYATQLGVRLPEPQLVLKQRCDSEHTWICVESSYLMKVTGD